MHSLINTRFAVALVLAVLAAGARAEPAWVSDEFEIMLRTGPSTGNAIQRMLRSGTEVEVLQRDPDSGYSRVRAPDGTEGGDLEPPGHIEIDIEPGEGDAAARFENGKDHRQARAVHELVRLARQWYGQDHEVGLGQQLRQLTSQLTNAENAGSSLTAQLQAIRAEHREAEETIATLEREKQALERQLAEIRRTASDVLAIDEQNRRLQQELTDAEIRVDTLEQEIAMLAGQQNRNWFIAGASVLVVGLLLGLWLPRIRWQRRSRYERF